MTRLRQRIAQRLVEAQSTQALLTSFNEVDLAAVQELRARYKDSFEKTHGVKLGFMSFFVKAIDRGAEEIPGRQRLGRRQRHHLSRVLRHRRRGLDRPRPDGADRARCGYQELRGHREGNRRPMRRARAPARSPSRTSRAAPSPSPTAGCSARCMSTPIVNAPQSAILGMHKIQERPMVVHGQIADPAHDVSGRHLRSPHHRWPRGRAVPGRGQGLPRGSRPHAVADLTELMADSLDVVVIGGGPAGYPAAIRAGQNELQRRLHR